MKGHVARDAHMQYESPSYELGLSYCTCALLVIRPFMSFSDFLLVTLTFKFNLLFKNVNRGYN